MKRRAFIRVISYIGAVLMATAVILLILAVIKVPVENPDPKPADRNQTEQTTGPDQNDADQPASGNSGGATPSPSSNRSSNIGQPAGPSRTGGVQTSPAPTPAQPAAPAPTPAPGPDPDPPQQSVLDMLLDGVQNVLPEGGLL